MKRKIYYVNGMHCSSCEILIEKRILEEKGVKAVDVSVGNGTVVVEHDGRVPYANDLNQWFKKEGYVFSDKKETEQKEPLIYFVEGKGLQIDKKVLEKKIKTILKIALIVFVLYEIEKSGLAQYITVSDSSSLSLFFVFGLLAGLSSCAALVGGILLSMTKSFSEKYDHTTSTKTKAIPHLYFHSGRILSYAVFGGFLGAIGKTISFENVTVYAFLIVVVSIAMCIIGLQMAGVRWAEKIQIRMPKFISRKVAGKDSQKLPFVVGAGTILLPCGFTLIAQGITLTSGSFLKGSLILLSFALGTMIPLVLISLASIQGSKNAKRAKSFSFYVGVVLVLFGLYNINAQLNVLGFPSLNDLSDLRTQNVNTAKQNTNVNGNSQTVNLIAKGFEYTLVGSSKFKAGVPTKLVVDDQGMRGCGVFLASRGLINGYVSLKSGENIIDLGKPKAGAYKITCSMGMVRPVSVVFE